MVQFIRPRAISGLGAAAVGALHPASSAPSRVRVPRVGALESPQPGLHSDVGRGTRTRDAAEKSWPEVRLFDAPLAGRAGCPRKVFAEPRLPEKVLKPVERAGAAICTNSVAEIMLGVPPRGAT